MREVGISEHTDFEVVTVMHQKSPGLWLRSPGAEAHWYELPHRPELFTVILGVSWGYRGQLSIVLYRPTRLKNAAVGQSKIECWYESSWIDWTLDCNDMSVFVG